MAPFPSSKRTIFKQILSPLSEQQVSKRLRPKHTQMLYFVVFGHQNPFDMIRVKAGHRSCQVGRLAIEVNIYRMGNRPDTKMPGKWERKYVREK